MDFFDFFQGKTIMSTVRFSSLVQDLYLITEIFLIIIMEIYEAFFYGHTRVKLKGDRHGEFF